MSYFNPNDPRAKFGGGGQYPGYGNTTTPGTHSAFQLPKPDVLGSLFGVGGGLSLIGSQSSLQTPTPSPSFGAESGGFMDKIGDGFGAAGDFVKRNKDVLSMLGKGAAGVVQAKAMLDEQKARRKQEDEEREERERKRKNDENLSGLRAQLLAAMMQNSQGN